MEPTLKYSTEHYVFHYCPHSAAERDIMKIAEYQEQCYEKITAALRFAPGFRIQYYLFDTPEEVGKAYGDEDDSPCNGFTRMPDSIYAVYNDEVQCIGMHEDTHLISYSRKRPGRAFLREGLAMYMDETWWGRPNVEWVAEFLQRGCYVSVGELLKNERFFSVSDAIAYPIAGSFVRYLIEKLSMEQFLKEVYYSEDWMPEQEEAAFLKWVHAMQFD